MRTRPAAEIAPPVEVPLVLNAPKLCAFTDSSPTVAMSSSGTNFSTVVRTCVAAMFRIPDRLIRAGSHNPTKAMTADHRVLCEVLTKTSTYPTRATTIAAFPAHAVIPQHQALRKPPESPKASRA